MGGILPKAALIMSKTTSFFYDVNVLVPVWLGGRGDRPGFPIGRSRIFLPEVYREELTDTGQPNTEKLSV